MRYLIDSDALIASKNLYYQPDFCEAFWDWVVDGHKAGILFSIDKVHAELQAAKKEDPLHTWVKRPELAKFFLPSVASAPKWAEIAAWVDKRKCLQAAKDHFLLDTSADAWLISYAAMHGDFLIITNEVAAPDSKKRIALPDAATALSVQTISLFEVLHGSAHKTFKYK